MGQDNRAGLWIGVLIGAGVLAVLAYTLFRGEMPGGQAEQADEASSEAETVLQLDDEIAKVVAGRKTWDLDFRPWMGREAGDLVVMGIDGKEHKLSDYRGREVMVVFWATWCPACRTEIPHLIALRDAVGQDELAILAVSNEPADELQSFVKENEMNYTVATISSDLPQPFAGVQGIPTTFFIDAEGKIKLVAVGLISFEESLAIVNANGEPLEIKEGAF
ncbi:MAG: TlpA family protein disulfide reductase [Phycisphaerae bacterium]|nr:TlpA family protein disulfide reductase [Phycisphaerae bacterium]